MTKIANLETRRIAELDGLRGLAIILVLVWHFIAGQVQVAPGTASAYALRLVGFTWAGVDIFFVLSGYLVGSLLIKARDRGHGIATILVRRMFRIVPLYALSLAAFVGMAVSYPADRHGGGLGWLLDDPMPMWSHALLVQNVVMATAREHGANWLGITWSLALEVQFYLLLAGFVLLVPKRFVYLALVTLVGMAVGTRVALTLMVPEGGFAGFLILPGRCDSVAFGMMAAKASEGGRSIAAAIAARARLVLWGIAAALAIVIGLCAKGHGIGSLGMNAVGHLLLSCSSAALIVVLMASPEGPVQRVFRTPPLIFLGTVSYGIYVIHQPVSGLLHHTLLEQAPRIASSQDAAVTLLALLVTVAGSCASWCAIERPMIALSHRLTVRG